MTATYRYVADHALKLEENRLIPEYFCHQPVIDTLSLQQRCNKASAIYPFRPRQNGGHLADDIFKVIFFCKDCRVLIQISLIITPNESETTICIVVSEWIDKQWTSIGLDNGLAPKYATSQYLNQCLYICVSRPRWVLNHSLVLLWRTVITISKIHLWSLSYQLKCDSEWLNEWALSSKKCICSVCYELVNRACRLAADCRYPVPCHTFTFPQLWHPWIKSTNARPSNELQRHI